MLIPTVALTFAQKEGGTIPVIFKDLLAAENYINPLPHALMLTAIVVSLGTTGVGLALLMKIKDLYGTIEAVLFPKVYQKFSSVVEVDNVVTINGKLQIRDGHEPSLMIENIAPLVSAEKTETKVEVKKQYLAINASGLDSLDDLLEILSGYPGDITVYIKRDGKTYKLSEKIRHCRGLISELEGILNEEDIIFIEK